MFKIFRMDIQSINIFGKGLQKSLGKLETRVMDTLWSADEPLSARVVTDNLCCDDGISFSAISTVLNRLEKKGMVERIANGKRYAFKPVMEKDDYSKMILETGLKSLLSDKSLLSAAGLSGDGKVDQEVIDLLKNFIEKNENK